MSLRNKLSGSYILIVVMCVALISFLSNFLIEWQFREYVSQNQEEKNINIVSSLAKNYQNSGGWDSNMLETLGVNALEASMILMIFNEQGEILWDAKVHNHGMCQKIIENMAAHHVHHFGQGQGGYVEKSYPIRVDNKLVGSVNVGFYGPFYFTERDVIFLNTFNRLFMGVGVLSLLIAVLVGTWMSKKITGPIFSVVHTTQQISRGNFDDHVPERQDTREVSALAEAVNHLAQTLKNQEILRKRLTADVAHELRTPLTTLQSHLEAMVDGIWQADAERLKSCHDETRRIIRLVGELERLAKVESENLVLQKTNFEMMDMLRSILNNFEKEFLEKGISLQLNGSQEIVYGDRDKIAQVVVNLVVNALTYTPKGGAVTLSVEKNPDGVNLRVKDTGVGISKEDAPYIFERFYRSDTSRARATGGFGIGLTIAKAIVAAHGGTLSVSDNGDPGAEFIVTLPRAEA